MSEPIAVTGAVLAGGASRRMGRTKALVAVDGIPMSRRVADALLGGGCSEVMLVGGRIEELAPLGLRHIPDEYPGEGPVGGLITALRRAVRTTHVLVAACDLPMLDAGTVAVLVERARTAVSAPVVVARAQRVEPMLAVWNVNAVDELTELFDDGERTMRSVLSRFSIETVAVAPSALVNVNRPDDLPGSAPSGQ